MIFALDNSACNNLQLIWVDRLPSRHAIFGSSAKKIGWETGGSILPHKP